MKPLDSHILVSYSDRVKIGDLVRWKTTSWSAGDVCYFGIILDRWHDGTSYIDINQTRPFMVNKVLLMNGRMKELSDTMLEVISEKK